jgi:hypothetical protein
MVHSELSTKRTSFYFYIIAFLYLSIGMYTGKNISQVRFLWWRYPQTFKNLHIWLLRVIMFF